MIWHWTGLAVFSLTLLPAGLALLTGRIPHRLHARLAPARPRGWALLCLWAAAPLNTIPRLADASPSITLAATAMAGTAALTGCALTAAAALRTSKVAR
ncbi:hypothetical protein [Streptomyces viridochromogenes]|uniref:Integral membrane protein n=1 Tax=Streptomyces viridochromogenes Tue57 TaxID=1160705 RepID=L8PK60_STRVR|nr:hypothetical protein [Streptomyces viridochromogenes]ELS56629.1 hypothetical protein STVIR_2390 [Streptomyces viridochromogenes Tue57]